jgi:dihydroorotase
MPNTNPPVSDAQTARRIQEEAASYDLADVIQSVSITAGQEGSSIAHLAELEGIPLVSEDGCDVADAARMLEALTVCAHKHIVAACHCEDAALSREAKKHRAHALSLLSESGGLYGAGEHHAADDALKKAHSLLALAEDIATERNLTLAEDVSHEARIHICHVSTARSLYAIVRAKQKKACSVSCEVTPHHLALSIENGETAALITDPASSAVRPASPGLRRLVNPPLRPQSDRAVLLKAIASGAIDVIATDHAPHTVLDKEQGAPGFPGLETAFAVCNTVLVKSGIITLQRLSALMSAHPARLLGLSHEKGRLLSGYAADFILVNPEESWTVDSKAFYTKGAYSPFDGKIVAGKIVSVFRRGKKVFPF